MKRERHKSLRTNSYLEQEREFVRRDKAMKARGASYYQSFRHMIFPPSLEGRSKRMVVRIVDQVRQLTSVSRFDTPTWMDGESSRRWSRKRLAESVGALRRYISEFDGRPEEFSPIIRAFLKGNTNDKEFKKKITWALRLFEEAAFGPVEKDMFGRHLYPEEQDAPHQQEQEGRDTDVPL